MCLLCAAAGGIASWAAFDHDAAASTAAADSPQAALYTSVGATGDAYVDGVLSGLAWTGAITYSFPDARGDYEEFYSEADAPAFAQVSAAQQQAARLILEGGSAYGGGGGLSITAFEQFTNAQISDAGSDGADIRIARSSEANPTAFAYYPSSSYHGGDVWFGNNYDDLYRSPKVGDYGYMTMLHELGHALGLKHGHAAGGVSNVAVPSDRDAMEYTVMTYRSYVGAWTVGYTNETYGYAQTFMMLDIAALQHIYGANFDTNSGDTVYTWSPTTGETFVDGLGQGTPGANRVFMTLWDGGGVDTYDFSNYATNLQVDLRPGQHTLISDAQRAYLGDGRYARGNVYNALQYQGDARSLIENAIGGSGHDVIIGNAAENVLVGNAGNDTLVAQGAGDDLYGGSGDDILVVAEADVVDGGAGYDIVRVAATGGLLDLTAVTTIAGVERIVGSDNADRIVVSHAVLAGITAINGGLGSDTLTAAGDSLDLTGIAVASIETITTSSVTGTTFFVDTVASALAVLGGAGAQDNLILLDLELSPAQRADLFARGVERLTDDSGSYVANPDPAIVLAGSDAAEALVGGTGNDRLQGNGGNDSIRGDLGDDVLFGGAGEDALGGSSGNDRLVGGPGNDRLFGGPGADVLGGEDGDDYLVGGNGGDGLFGGAGRDSLNGGKHSDYMSGGDGDDGLFGGFGDDGLNGDDGDDYMVGGDGSNSLFGGAGNDSLNGGSDSDYMCGGDGDDGLFGGLGDDTLNGGGGTDWLVSGSGRDIFLFEGDFGADTIADFDAVNDVINLSGAGQLTFADILARAAPSGSNTVIDLGDGNTITLVGVGKVNLQADDFAL